MLGDLCAVFPSASQGDAVAIALHGGDGRVGQRQEFFVEGRNGAVQDLGISEGTDSAAASKHDNANTQAMQCLPQFQAYDSGPHHRHGFGQVAPCEHIIADDQALGQGPERIRVGGTGIGCDDDAPGGDPGMVGDRDPYGCFRTERIRVGDPARACLVSAATRTRRSGRVPAVPCP